MFYDKDLMSSKSLGKVWLAGNSVTYDSDEDISMTNVCEKLDSWVDSEHEEVHRRLALRTSAIFVKGAARLYKRKMQQLLDDVVKLHTEIAAPKKFRYFADSTNDSENWFDETVPNGTETTTYETETSDLSNCSAEQNENIESDENEEHSEISNSVDVQEYFPTPTKVDKEIQTDFTTKVTQDGSFDENLPFGYIMVHDNYHSRIPSRIIISSINPESSVAKVTQDGSFDENLPFGYIMIHDNYHSRIPSRIIISSINPEVVKLS